MPTKNARRILAAEDALNRVVNPRHRRPNNKGRLAPAQVVNMLPPQPRRKRSFRSQRDLVALLSSPPSYVNEHANHFIRSLYNDRLLFGLHLPAHDFTGQFARIKLCLRDYRLTRTDRGQCWMLLNPWLSFATAAYVSAWSNDSANANSTQKLLYSIIAGNTSTHTAGTNFLNGGWPQPTGTYEEIKLSEVQIESLAGGMCSADVRCLGVKYDIDYTGTDLNMGGTVTWFANPEELNMLALDPVYRNGGNQTQAGITNFPTTANASLDSEAFITVPIERSKSFVWRPQNLNFRKVKTAYDLPSATTIQVAGGAGLQFPPDMDDIIRTTTDDAGPVVPAKQAGWVSGFVIQPGKSQTAAGTAETSDYIVNIEIELELNAVYTGTNVSTTGFAAGRHVFALTERTHSHGPSHDAISKALSDVHAARSNRNFLRRGESMVIHAAQNVGKLGKKIATNAAVESIAARIASSV